MRSLNRGRSERSEAGDTLIEVLLALIVLALASVAVIIAFTTTIGASSEHRNLATFNTVLRSATESAISQIQGNGAVTFNSCATASYYQTGPGAVNFANISPAGTNYSAQITGVSYWNGTSFSTSGCVAGGNEPQQITLTVTNNNNQTTYSNSFVVDNSVAVPALPLCVQPNCTPTHLIFSTQPSGAVAGQPFSTQPVVWAVTSANTIARHDASTVNLTITAGTGAPGAAILGSCQGVETSGVTTFSGCGIDLGSQTQYTLTASDPSLGLSVVSQPFYNYTQLTAPVITSAKPDLFTPGGLDVSFNGSTPLAGLQSYTAEICTDAGMTLGCVTQTLYTSGSTIQGVIGKSYYAQITALPLNGYLGATSTVFGPSLGTAGPIGPPGTPTLTFGTVAGSVTVTFAPSSPVVAGQTYSAKACTDANMTANCVSQGVIASGGNLTGLNFTPGSSGGVGTVYFVTVTANPVTGFTASAPSAHSSSHASTSQVNPPTNVTTNNAGGRDTLTVNYTNSTGISPVSYTDTLCDTNGQNCQTKTLAPTGYTFTGLNRRTNYQVTVTALAPSNAYVSNNSNTVTGQSG